MHIVRVQGHMQKLTQTKFLGGRFGGIASTTFFGRVGDDPNRVGGVYVSSNSITWL